MMVSTRYNKGAGNAAVYARLRNAVGHFWNFVTLAWVAVEVANCRFFLLEVQDSDEDESLFTADIPVPAGGWAAEAIAAATGAYLGGGAAPIDLTNIMEAQTDLATGINLLLTNVGTLLDIGQGKWEIVDNKMIFYTRAGGELMRFNLQDASGSPSMAEVFKRIPA